MEYLFSVSINALNRWLLKEFSLISGPEM